MKKFLTLAALFILTCRVSINAQNTEQPFLYPQVPENLESLQERTTFMVEHFWEKCNMKSIFSSRKNFEKAFYDYISYMPYADSTIVFDSVNKLIKEVKKTPQNAITMGEVARANLYSDSAKIQWDELYLPFARATSQLSGLPKAVKEQYLTEISQLENSLLGHRLPDVALTLDDGTTKNLNDFEYTYLLVFFDDPDDFNNTMARVRLSTDYGLNGLIERNFITVVSLFDGNPDEQWKERVKDYPDNWIKAASPQAAMLFDRRVKPTFYYTNKEHRILSKTLDVDNLVTGFRTVLDSQNQIKAERERLRQEALKNREQSTKP